MGTAGDTVNMASRMQSNGKEYQIQVSQFTHDMLLQDYKFTGPVKIKVSLLSSSFFISISCPSISVIV